MRITSWNKNFEKDTSHSKNLHIIVSIIFKKIVLSSNSKKRAEEFPLWLRGLRTQHSVCEDSGSIPGFAHGLRIQCCHSCSVGHR